MYKKLNQDVEFYFGKGVGTQIYNALNEAQKSIFIVSPYVSEGYVDFLLRKQSEGIDVSLVTTADSPKDKTDEICKKIIVQHRIVNEKKIQLKRKAKFRCVVFGVITLLSLLAGLFWYLQASPVETNWFWQNSRFIGLFGVGCLLVDYVLYKMFHRLKVFSYLYTTRFSFKIIPSLFSETYSSPTRLLDTFVHAKIYIIDSETIFIGSANLTYAGIRHNIESLIKISAPDTVNEVMNEIDNYLLNNCRTLDTNLIGASLYNEPSY